MDKLLLVDGSNLLFQMFYGMPARIVNKDGKPIQGTLGFVGALLKIIRMTQPTHIAVLFDGEHEHTRTRLDAGYKANRTDYSGLPEEDTPFSQLPDIYAALDYLGIAHCETTDCETDDWMAAYALTVGKDAEVIIVSQDSDFFQLITDQVRILRYRGKSSVLCDAAYIRDKFGVMPSQYAALKSLTGDPSDNITGIKGIGPKTGAALLNQFGSLEQLLANPDTIKKPCLRESVRTGAERIQKNYRLILLENTAALPFAMEELVYRPGEVTTTKVLAEIGLR